VFHSYSTAALTNTVDYASREQLIINNKEIIIVWDVVAVERANPMDAKAMEVVAPVVATV
jgi:hypothetical protein